jgi:hypothetical protein
LRSFNAPVDLQIQRATGTPLAESRRVVRSEPLWIRRWALITLGVWVAMLGLALLLLARRPEAPRRESLMPRDRQPIVSEPPPMPQHIHYPVA